MIYLDAAATAEYGVYSGVGDIIIDTMTNAMKQYWKNPSSLYASDVKEEINKCRANIAKFIGAKSNEIYFTSGASESNSWAIRGWVDNKIAHNFESLYGNMIIITTPIEHKSIMGSMGNRALGACVWHCDVDEFGFVDINHLGNLLSYQVGKPVLVSIGLANNEIGTIQNIKEISNLVHRYNGVLHIDATQAFGHIPIDVSELGVDLMSASGHKISPVLKGVGFLYKRNDIDIQPLIYGAQENSLRGGTENTFGIIGLNKAVELCVISTDKIKELCDKRDYFIESLKTKFGVKLNGHPTHRLPNNINVTFPNNITGEALLYTLEMSGIYVSTGSACNSNEIKPSYVLNEIGLSDDQAMKTLRFTLSYDITYDEIDYVVSEIDKAIRVIEM